MFSDIYAHLKDYYFWTLSRESNEYFKEKKCTFCKDNEYINNFKLCRNTYFVKISIKNKYYMNVTSVWKTRDRHKINCAEISVNNSLGSVCRKIKPRGKSFGISLIHFTNRIR